MYKTLHKTLYRTDICHCIYRAAVYKIKQENQLNAHAFPPLCLYFWKQGVAADAHHDQNDILTPRIGYSGPPPPPPPPMEKYVTKKPNSSSSSN